MSHQPKKIGILVGGGPAPGINAVIGAATIRAVLAGHEVTGILDGFSHVMKGDIAHVRRLSIDNPCELAKFASALGISPDEFQRQFAYLVEDEPAPRHFFPEDGAPSASTRELTA